MKYVITDVINKGCEIVLLLGYSQGQACGDYWEDAPWDRNAGLVYDEYVAASLHLILNDSICVEDANINLSKTVIRDAKLAIASVRDISRNKIFDIHLGDFVTLTPFEKNVKHIYRISALHEYIQHD